MRSALVVGILFLVSVGAVAQNAVPSSINPKMAFFMLGIVVNDSPKAKRIFAELEGKKEALNKTLEDYMKKGQDLENQLQSPSLSEQVRATKKRELEELEFQVSRFRRDSQEELDKLQQKSMTEFFDRANPIIQTLAKEQNLQVVLSGDNFSVNQLVVWADESWWQAFSKEVAKRFEASDASAGKPVVTPSKPTPGKPVTPGQAPTKPVIKKP